MYIHSLLRVGFCLILLGFVSSCSRNSHNNVAFSLPKNQNFAESENFEVVEPAAGHFFCGKPVAQPKDKFVALTLSGGGARAAAFGAAFMFELEEMGILSGVDVISAVSGGGIPAAYYALSCDVSKNSYDNSECALRKGVIENVRRPVWDRQQLNPLLEQNYLARALLNRLWPDNLVRLAFTSFDSTDVFAETLSDNLFDISVLGGNRLTFSDINSKRPTLVLNATSYTSGDSKDHFTFTDWDFRERLNSNICEFPVDRAVAASSAYPGVFAYTTLAKFGAKPDDENKDSPPESYLHLFDGGANDNLGLSGVRRAMRAFNICAEGTVNRQICGYSFNPIPSTQLIVVDAQNGFDGIDSRRLEPRELYDRLVDTNFLDAYDTLMHRNYGLILNEALDELAQRGFFRGSGDHSRGEIFHVPLKALDAAFEGYQGTRGRLHAEAALVPSISSNERAMIYQAVNQISTSYGLTKPQHACLRAAAHILAWDNFERFADVFEDVKEPSNSGFVDDKGLCIASLQNT